MKYMSNKIALKEYELKALQAQINPHFLYNTLSMMNWMAIRSNQMEISKVTLALSTFYSTALSKGEDVVTVENCIQNMEAYLEIQLTMHDNNFTVTGILIRQSKMKKCRNCSCSRLLKMRLSMALMKKRTGQKNLPVFPGEW